MSDISFRAASSLQLGELAALFTAAYENYVMPFALDEAQLRRMTVLYDFDLDASVVAVRDNEPVGLANLGARGHEGWVGGVGVVASARRGGVGRALMTELHERARERGVQRMWLEVIVENDGAFRLYRELGYEVTREVEVWTLDAEVPAPAATEVPVAAALDRIAAQRDEREPWQRADETVLNDPGARALAVDGGWAVFSARDGRATLLQAHGDDAPTVLAAVRAHGSLVALNLPQGSALARGFESLGGRSAVRQREMLLAL